MGQRAVQEARATEHYLDYLVEQAEAANVSSVREVALRRQYLPGALALAAAYTRSEGFAMGVDSEFRASKSLGLTRDSYRSWRLEMQARLHDDLVDDNSSWHAQLKPAAADLVRSRPQLPGFEQLKNLTQEVATQDSRLALLSDLAIGRVVGSER